MHWSFALATTSSVGFGCDVLGARVNVSRGRARSEEPPALPLHGMRQAAE
jgi:hypothetical protein